MKNKNGITLIALVITVILMMILAGVVVTGIRDGKLFHYAAKAKNDTEMAQYLEALQVAIVQADNFDDLKAIIQRNKLFKDATIIENANNKMLFVRIRR